MREDMRSLLETFIKCVEGVIKINTVFVRNFVGDTMEFAVVNIKSLALNNIIL